MKWLRGLHSHKDHSSIFESAISELPFVSVQNESWCITFHYPHVHFYANQTHFHSWTRFQTEAKLVTRVFHALKSAMIRPWGRDWFCHVLLLLSAILYVYSDSRGNKCRFWQIFVEGLGRVSESLYPIRN